jgi:hypothetical protein
MVYKALLKLKTLYYYYWTCLVREGELIVGVGSDKCDIK